ncbi:MAG: prolipoprotein diacylglyceryl transferase [Gammaproteobacteria bacterium]|nr:MAG: prolipoprotein diacylglyceryl transferase [Gammaproteobacteria bacterium]
MLRAPDIDPIAISIGPLAVHWYGLMYVVGFLAGWWIGAYRAGRPNSGWTKEEVSDLLVYAAVGVIVGGRLGYALFYNLPDYLANPLAIFQIWKGGMSFHGGFLGVIIAMWVFAWRTRRHWFTVTDFIAPLVAIGLGAGRLGNFINQELWGRVTDVPWGMVFRNAGAQPRHPSQLYEFMLEGVVLFLILWFYSIKPRPMAAVSGLFLLGYGTFRFLVEFVREPDAQIGFLAFSWVTMGQVLSFPMILFGVGIMIWAYRRQPA